MHSEAAKPSSDAIRFDTSIACNPLAAPATWADRTCPGEQPAYKETSKPAASAVRTAELHRSSSRSQPSSEVIAEDGVELHGLCSRTLIERGNLAPGNLGDAARNQ